MLLLGYVCPCGERVIVFRLFSELNSRMDTKVVTCRNGHPRCIPPEDLWTFDEWHEDEQQLQPQTA